MSSFITMAIVIMNSVMSTPDSIGKEWLTLLTSWPKSVQRLFDDLEILDVTQRDAPQSLAPDGKGWLVRTAGWDRAALMKRAAQLPKNGIPKSKYPAGRQCYESKDYWIMIWGGGTLSLDRSKLSALPHEFPGLTPKQIDTRLAELMRIPRESGPQDYAIEIIKKANDDLSAQALHAAWR